MSVAQTRFEPVFSGPIIKKIWHLRSRFLKADLSPNCICVGRKDMLDLKEDSIHLAFVDLADEKDLRVYVLGLPVYEVDCDRHISMGIKPMTGRSVRS